MQKEMINILIADDHPVIINSLKYYFKKIPQINIEEIATNGFEVLALLEEKKIDIVLLDAIMPKMDGLKCARLINYYHSNVKVIMYTGYSDNKLVKRLMAYNIKGFLLKSTSMECLHEAIISVNEGNTCIDNSLDENLIDYYNDIEPQCGSLPNISKREKQILEFICLGLSNEEMRIKLGLSIHTIETHRQRLMQKAKRRNVADLVRWSFENELVP